MLGVLRALSILGTFWLVIESGAAVGAEEKKSEPNKYTATVAEGGREVDKTFDLSKPDQVQELTDLLAKGEVEHLAKDKPPDLLAIYWDLGLWTLVVFVLLYFVLRRLAWGPMLDGLRKREDNIRGALEEAQRAQEEARSMRAQLQQQLDRAQETVRDILDEARRKAQQSTDEMVAKARAEIQGERDRLRREIEIARDQALHELWAQTAHLATLVSSKAIRRALSEDDHRRLVDEALAEMRQAGTNRN
jgi:F-type H+-transporting ATPase subunit b